MDYINSLGALVLDHRFRRLTETLLQAADEIYAARGLTFRARWASTYRLLSEHEPLTVTELARHLRVTHPAIIGITNDMMDAGLVTPITDRHDARRRPLTLSVSGTKIHAELRAIWAELERVQAGRFKSAGCNIVRVLDRVEAGMAERGIADAVITALSKPRRRQTHAQHLRKAGALLLCLHTLPACAPAMPPATTAATQRVASLDTVAVRVVDAVADSLVPQYIYEGVARDIADSIRKAVRRGAFGSALDTAHFVGALNAELLRLSNDRHLRVRHGSVQSSGVRTLVRRAPDGNAIVNPSPQHATRSRLDGTSAGEQYFARAHVLPGNVGYLDLRGFPEDPAAVPVIDSLMGVLAGIDGLIIDLGNNRGGGPSIIRHLSAYLFDRPVHLVSTFQRGMTEPRERWTVERVPGKKLTNIPVVLLTSRRTFSAAESFAFGLKTNQRVTIIGERTGGGGHFGRVVQLPEGFTMFLPIGRTYDPRTNEGWEATGLQPDIEVIYKRALETAIERLRRR